jgi:hypothetical protein
MVKRSIVSHLKSTNPFASGYHSSQSLGGMPENSIQYFLSRKSLLKGSQNVQAPSDLANGWGWWRANELVRAWRHRA